MAKTKKLSPPTWDEKNQRWKKVAYCNNMSKTFYSKKRGVTSAEKEIAYQINEWKENIINDFEASVFPKFPIIGTLKEKLYQSGAIYAAMSGSGSSVYGLFTPGTLLPDMTRKEADCRVFKLTLN